MGYAGTDRSKWGEREKEKEKDAKRAGDREGKA